MTLDPIQGVDFTELFFIRICLCKVKDLWAKRPASDFKQPRLIRITDKFVQPATWLSSWTKSNAGPCPLSVPISPNLVSWVGVNLPHEPQTEPSLLKWGLVLQFTWNPDAASSTWRCHQMGHGPCSTEGSRWPQCISLVSFVKQVLVNLLRNTGSFCEWKRFFYEFPMLRKPHVVCSAKTSRSWGDAQGKLQSVGSLEAAGACPPGRQVVRTHQELKFSVALFFQTCQPIGASESPLSSKGLQSQPRTGRSAPPDTATVFASSPFDK